MATTSRAPATPLPIPASPDDEARAALAKMVEALELIDASEGAMVAGAHLDLAINRLQEWLDRSQP